MEDISPKCLPKIFWIIDGTKWDLKKIPRNLATSTLYPKLAKGGSKLEKLVKYELLQMDSEFKFENDSLQTNPSYLKDLSN